MTDHNVTLHLKVTLTSTTKRAKPEDVYDALYDELLSMSAYVEDPNGDDITYEVSDVVRIQDRTTS